MNVLSLFDGMSCGQQALERCNINVDNYFASEIDKYAIKVTQANYPNTIQLGSVVNLDGKSLPKIDLLLGGSPCQSFSFGGKRKGMSTTCNEEIFSLKRYLELKEEGFEFEGQSYLFWEYMRILYEVKPKYFLLENVEMGEKWEKILSKAIGVNGIHINSSLVSAQNRKRIYWTNIGLEPAGLFGYPQSIIEHPKNKGILLKDVLQDNPNPKYYLTNKMQEHLQSRDRFKLKNGNDKSGTITVCGEGKQGNNSTFICEPINDKYYISQVFYDWLKNHSLKRHSEFKITKGKRKSACLTVSALVSTNLSADFIINENKKALPDRTNVRRLTPIECERLQTVKDNYTNHVSDSQRYKMLGNGWTVDVICHILKYIK
jgi:DNA (cytosine-5)-methyltransferase 1